jgi:hypothetical protein
MLKVASILIALLFITLTPMALAHHNEAHNIIHDDPLHRPDLPDNANQNAIDALDRIEDDVIDQLTDNASGHKFTPQHVKEHHYTNSNTRGDHPDVHISTKHHAIDTEKIGVVGTFEFDVPVGSDVEIQGVYVQDDHKEQVFFPAFPLTLPIESTQVGDDNFVYHETDYITMDNVRGNSLDAFDYWIDQNIFDEFGELELFGFVFYEKAILGLLIQ